MSAFDPEISEQFNAEANTVELKLGDKFLSISLPSDTVPEFVTGIVKLPEDTPKIPGATTALYIRAREIMQETVNTLGRPVTYGEIIDSPKMIEWARIHGQRIFGWYVKLDTPDEFIAELVFTPKK